MANASRVQITIEAKDAASGILRAIGEQFGALGGLMEELTAKNVSWGNVAQQATTMVIEGLRESVSATVQYADEVRQLAEVSGQSTEEASRFIQVLDDYNLTTQDAITATRTLTKNGLVPNLETLAKLSDEYLSLNDAQARNELIIKNLGRGGLEWVEILKQGSAAIREQSAAVDSNFVLTEQAVQQARNYEIALDNWNDSVQAAKISLGSALLPALTQVINGFNDSTRAAELAAEQGQNYATMNLIERDALLQQAAAEREKIDALKTSSMATQDLSDANKDVIKDYDKIIGLAQQVGTNTADAFKKAAFATLQFKLAADGTISPEDEEMLEKAGVALGIVDQKAIGDAETISILTEKFKAGTITAQQYADALNAIPTEINTDVNTIYNTYGEPGTPTQGVGPPRSSTGSDFIVPPGFPNDSFAMYVESGEHVQVTPRDQVALASGAVNQGRDQVLQNNGTINIYLSGERMTVKNFMAELGAAM